MKWPNWILKLFGKKKVEPVPPTTPPVVKKIEPIRLSKEDKRRNALKAWQSKKIKTSKAHRLPLAKMLNPQKYIK